MARLTTLMAKRPCIEPGCPILTTSTRCPDHTRARDKARGTKQQRGYGTEHQSLRAQWQRLIDAGQEVRCWRCGTLLVDRAWHLDHTGDRASYRGPSCIPCNLHLAGKARHEL